MENGLEKVVEFINPTKIVESNNCENANYLTIASVQQVMLNSKEYCSVKSNGYIVLDFGKEICGGVRILNVGDFSKLRIRFGESLSESYADLGENNANNDHSVRDMEVESPFLSDLTFAQTGYRFIRIDNIGKGNVKFVAVYGAYSHLKQLPIGSFECDDEVVNNIYNTASHTLFLCMQNRLWDGIKRDRLVWIGDMHPEAKGIFYLYGDSPLIELGLSETAENTPSDKWINNIPSYSFWWLAILCDYEFYCDKWSFAEKWLTYADNLIAKISHCVSDNGAIDYGENNNMFLNWETSEDNTLECGNRGLLLWALNKYSAMLSRHNRKSKTADEVIEKLQKNTLFNSGSKAVASLYALGYGVNEQVKKVLCDGKTDGFSTFMSYYIASAISDCGESELSLKLLKEFYNGMLERGATSFWESFDTSWLENSGRVDELPKTGVKDIHTAFGKYCYKGYRLSLCHGWSSGPIQFLTENALGVKFIDAGGKKIKIEPNLMGLKWAKGVVPTKYGNIEVENSVCDETVKTKVLLPKGVKLIKK